MPGRLAGQLAPVAGGACLVLFVLINVSDWPGGFWNAFWLDHAIVGATTGTLLLAATVFLIYRHRDQQQQDLVDESIVDAGRTELVDRLVELDVALALLCTPTEPDLCRDVRWLQTPHGLEWLTAHLDEAGVVLDASWAGRDPRFQAHAAHVGAESWRLLLLEEMVRRVAGGVRDWGPILIKSRAGERDLVAFANVRLVLLQLQRGLRLDAALSTAAVRDLQHVIRRFAHLLEVDGQTPQPRARLNVLAFEHELAERTATTTDTVVVELLGRIESHLRSRVRRSRRPTPDPRAPIGAVQTRVRKPASLDGAVDRVPH